MYIFFPRASLCDWHLKRILDLSSENSLVYVEFFVIRKRFKDCNFTGNLTHYTPPAQCMLWAR